MPFLHGLILCLIFNTFPVPLPRANVISSPVRSTNRGIPYISELTVNDNLEKGGCPRITIKGVKEINEGEVILFRAIVEDIADSSKLVFAWSVSNGTIVEGQGTAKLSVDTRDAGGQVVTANLTVSGLEANCPATASFSTNVVSSQPQAFQIDQFNIGDLAAILSRFDSPSLRPIDRQSGVKFGDLLARLDNYAIQLNNDQLASGYLIIYPSRRLSRYGAGAAQYIVNYLKRSRGINLSRIVVVTGNEIRRSVIQLWIIPAGASPPTPNFVECE